MYKVITQIFPALETENRLATHLNSVTLRHGFSSPGVETRRVVDMRNNERNLMVQIGCWVRT